MAFDVLPAFLQFTRKKRNVPVTPSVEGEGETSDLIERVGTNPNGVTPKDAPGDQSLGEMGVNSFLAQRAERARRVETAPPAAARTAEAVEPQPASRPRFVDPAGRLQKQVDYEEANPAKDGNGWKGVLMDAARGALMGFARGGVGGAIGGAALAGGRNALDKSSDERREQGQRVAGWKERLGEVRERQGWQAKLREAEADHAYKQAQTEAVRRKPEEIERRLDQADRRLEIIENYNQGRLDESAANRTSRESEGEKNRGLKRELGFASIEQRRAAAANNIQYREKKDAADRAQRASQHADRMALGRESLAERVNARLSQEASRKVAQGQRATAIRISAAKAKAWAEKEGAEWDDFVDALDENGVIIDK